ncbi:MAG: enoyl-CoA hydratase-related protein [bacterium]
MSYENILYDVRDRICYITINRPEAFNALSKATMEELRLAFLSANQDDNVRVLIITGAGDKSFVAGADISEFVGMSAVGASHFAKRGQHVFSLLEKSRKPSIAAVNGYALGGGCELAMACSIRVASEKAKFGQPEVGLGIIPGYMGTQRLPRLVGKGIALEMILTGTPIKADEAYRIGLVNKVVPPEDLMKACEKIAKRIIEQAPIAVEAALEAVNRGINATDEIGGTIEADLFGLTCSTEDFIEGPKAFLEKRKPEFKGK